jgi:septal ring factor EnvC (AmiA/AmiB activator)
MSQAALAIAAVVVLVALVVIVYSRRDVERLETSHRQLRAKAQDAERRATNLQRNAAQVTKQRDNALRALDDYRTKLHNAHSRIWELEAQIVANSGQQLARRNSDAFDRIMGAAFPDGIGEQP